VHPRHPAPSGRATAARCRGRCRPR
jgi:hypothetical protein